MPTSTLEQSDESTGGLLRVDGVLFDRDDYQAAGPDAISDLDVILPSLPHDLANENSWGNVARHLTEEVQQRDVKVSGLVRLSSGRSPKRRFEILQQWEGVVTELDGDALWAEIMDLTNSENPTEIVEIPLEEIPVSDRSLLNSGTVFYWSIGYETSPGGQIRRVSEIRIRRSPKWSQRSIEMITATAGDSLRQFTNDNNESSACE
jgi:hypothetical protein